MKEQIKKLTLNLIGGVVGSNPILGTIINGVSKIAGQGNIKNLPDATVEATNSDHITPKGERNDTINLLLVSLGLLQLNGALQHYLGVDIIPNQFVMDLIKDLIASIV